MTDHHRHPHASVRVPFAAVVLAMLPAVLDQTILATALPTIAADLGRLSDVSWVVTAYVVAAAATTPLWGKLGDRLGRKPMLELSLALFLAASAACGLAQGIAMLVGVARRAGRRRRRADDAGHGRRRRPRLAARARPLPGLHRVRVRRRHHRRPAARRPAGRPRLVALGVLREPAAGRWRRWPALRLRLPVAGAGARRRSARPRRRGAAGGGDQRVHAGLHLGRRPLRVVARPRSSGCSRPARPRRRPGVARAAGRRPGRAARPAAHPHGRRRVGARCSWRPARCSRSTSSCRCSCRRRPARRPTEAGLLLVPAMVGITVSTWLAGRAIEAHGPLQALPADRAGR